MSDDFDLDDLDFEDDDFGVSEFDSGEDQVSEERKPVTKLAKAGLDGVIGSATDNERIKLSVKEALPRSIGKNWEAVDDVVDIADKAKREITQPIRKEMVEFKRNVNKLTPVVSKYLGENIGSKFGKFTKVAPTTASVDPEQMEIANALGNIFTEESKIRMEENTKKTVMDMMAKQTDEDRFNLNIKTSSDILSNVKRISEYNRTITYPYQQKTLEYGIKRFHMLKQLLEVNKKVGEATSTYLKTIMHNTALPELVKQRNSELFQQMFVQKWYGTTLDGVVDTGRGMMRKFGQNITNKARDTGNTIADSMRSAGEMAAMVGDMSEQMEDMPQDTDSNGLKAGKLAARIGAGSLTKKGIDSLIKKVVDSNKDKQWFLDAVAQSDNVAANGSIFAENFLNKVGSSEGGFSGLMAPIARLLQESMPSNRREIANLDSHTTFSPTDPRQWDEASRESQVVIIPGWLERIHNILVGMSGVGEETGYSTKRGFASHSDIKKDLLNLISTDTQRENSMAEVDKLIKELTKDIFTISPEGKELLAEWIVKEAHQTSALDVRKLRDTSEFENLSGYTPELAGEITDGFSKDLGDGDLYGTSRANLKDIEVNRKLTGFGKQYKEVIGTFEDAQKVLNEAMAGSSRDTLRSLDMVDEKGKLKGNRIIEQRMSGIDIDDVELDGVKETPNKSNRIFGRKKDISNIGDNSRNAGVNNYDGLQDAVGNLLSDSTFLSNIENVITGISSISDTNKSILETLHKKDISGVTKGTTRDSGLDEMVDKNVKVKDYLSGILSAITTMHNANLAYYENAGPVKGRTHGMTSKVKDLLGKGFGAMNGVLGFGGKTLSFGVDSIKAIAAGMKEKFSFGPADVYVDDEKSPRITANDFRTKVMFLWKDGEKTDKRVLTPDDITGEVRGHKGEVIITEEEVTEGRIRVLRDGVFKKLGRGIGSLVSGVFNMAAGGMDASGFLLTKISEMGKGALDYLRKRADSFKDIYITKEDGTRVLLASAKDILSGKIFVEVEGEFVAVTKVADLFKGNLYRMGSDGEPVVIATMDDVKRGLSDIKGTVLEKAGTFARKAGGLLGGVFDLGATIAGKSMTLFGNILKTIQTKFESKALEKLILNIPKDIVISASGVVVNHNPEVAAKVTKTKKNTISQDPLEEPTKEEPDSRAEKASSRFGKMDVEKGKAYLKRVAKDPAILKKVVDDAFSKYRDENGDGKSKREFAADFMKDKLGDNWTERHEEMRDAIKGSKIAAGMKSIKDKVKDKLGLDSIKPNGKGALDTLKDLESSDDKKQSDAWLNRLKKSPTVLKSVITEAWEEHIQNGESPLSKADFTKQWLKEKFGMQGPIIGKVLETSDKLRIDGGVAKGISMLREKAEKSKLADRVRNSDIVKKVKKKAEDSKIGGKIQSGKDLASDLSSGLMAKMSEKFGKKKVVGDTDGDGIRENSVKDILKDRAAKLLRRKEETDKVKKGEESKGSGIWSKILPMLGLAVTAIGSLVGGIANIGKGILSVGWDLGKLVAKGLWQVIGPALGGLLKGGGALLKGGGKMLLGGGKALLKGVAKVAAPIAKKAVGFVAKKGLALLAGAALAATPVGWVLGVASIGWTAWEASSAVWAYFDRRKDIKLMEYLRHLEYGMVSGDDGMQHDSKVYLRYFEGEILSKGTIKGDRIEIGATTAEIWEEYRGDFGDGGDDEAGPGFKVWYEQRFLPVFYKWMSLCHSFDTAYKKTQEGGVFGGKDDLALGDMDEKLTPDLKIGIANASLLYPEVDFDPLEVMASPSTAVVTTTSRHNCEDFAKKIAGFLKGTKVDSEKGKGEANGKKVGDVDPTGKDATPSSVNGNKNTPKRGGRKVTRDKNGMARISPVSDESEDMSNRDTTRNVSSSNSTRTVANKPTKSRVVKVPDNVVKMPDADRVEAALARTPQQPNITVKPEVNVNLKDLPDNKGVEKHLQDNNRIAAEALEAQTKSNENMDRLIKLMERGGVGSTVPSTTANRQGSTTPAPSIANTLPTRSRYL